MFSTRISRREPDKQYRLLFRAEGSRRVDQAYSWKSPAQPTLMVTYTEEAVQAAAACLHATIGAVLANPASPIARSRGRRSDLRRGALRWAWRSWAAGAVHGPPCYQCAATAPPRGGLKHRPEKGVQLFDHWQVAKFRPARSADEWRPLHLLLGLLGRTPRSARAGAPSGSRCLCRANVAATARRSVSPSNVRVAARP